MADIGLAWVNPAPLTKPENVVNFAKKCEAMGAHSMWTIDRIAYDNLEPLTILAAAAGATQRIRLGTSVLLANLRHPSHVAKIVSTLDFISNGRVTLGLGFGSRESDYKAVELPFEQVPLAQFQRGLMETSLGPAEVLKGVLVPRLSAGARWSYRKFCRKVGEFALAFVR